MKGQSFRLAVAVLLTTSAVACQHPSTGRPRTATPAAPVVEGQTLTGNISAIDPAAGTVTVKLVFKRRVFAVAPDCEIITATRGHAKLTDVRVGDPVELSYVPGGDPPVVHRLAVRGVTKAERQHARETERLDRILTPDPAERP